MLVLHTLRGSRQPLKALRDAVDATPPLLVGQAGGGSETGREGEGEEEVRERGERERRERDNRLRAQHHPGDAEWCTVPPFLGVIGPVGVNKGHHESRRSSRDTFLESYITKYTSIQK
jgi:hypothetical protein